MDDFIKQLINALGDLHEIGYPIWRKRKQPLEMHQAADLTVTNVDKLKNDIEEFFWKQNNYKGIQHMK